MLFLLAGTSCIKDTYDMDKFSKKAHLSPTLAIAAVKGDITLADVVEPGDTVKFDPDNFVRIVFREDSIIEKKLEDFYDLEDLIDYTDTYRMGERSISPFTASLSYTLDQISQRFSPSLRAQFVALNDGLNHPFPAFPSTNLGSRTFTSFSSFENAVLASGFLDVTVRNNLPAPLNSISIQLYNTAGMVPINGAVTIPAVQAGQAQTVTLNLAGLTITNSITAAVTLSGSAGNLTPVKIDLANNNVQVSVAGRDIKVTSGRVILPTQVVETLEKKDTIDFDPGDNIEIDEIKTLTGSFDYTVQSDCPLRAALDFMLPDALRSGVPLFEQITILPNTIQLGTIPISNTLFNLHTDPDQPFNRIPLEYNLVVSSEGNMVNFNADDEIILNLGLSNPSLDYAKGYFGNQAEQIDPDSVDLEIDDILSKISGEYFISSPKITVDYRNSFAVPIELSLAVSGRRGSNFVNLSLLPMTLASPAAPGTKDIAASYTVDKNNSSLPAFVSLPPQVIRYSGTARMNPLNTGNLRNNYVFGDSRFLASLEIEVPLEFRINNLQFADTVDNFLLDDGSGESSVNADDFDMVRIDLDVENGLPVGISAAISLYDPVAKVVRSTVTASEIIKPAPVGTDGKANGVTKTSTSIEFTREFLSSVNECDKVIFRFACVTSDGGTKNVKIYSDNNIKFRAALVVKPDITLE